MNEEIKPTSGRLAVVQIGLILTVLYLTSWYSYLLFHSLVEFFGVIIATGIFAVSWNSRRFIDNHYFLLLGIAYFFVGLFDLLHLFSYEGVGIFKDASINLSTQLWLVSRYLVAASLAIAPLFIHRRLSPKLAFFAYLSVSLFFLAAIFTWHIFPAAYDQTTGLTGFKVVSEYAICLLLLLALALFYRQQSRFNQQTFRHLFAFSVLTLATELVLLGNLSQVGWANLLSHFFKTASFYLLYLGVLESGLMKPYRILFKNLKDSEKALKQSEERYRLLVELSPDAMIVHYFGQVAFANTAALNLLDARAESELIGKNILSFFHPDYQGLVASRIAQLQKGLRRAPLREARIITRRGRVVDVEISGTLVAYQGRTAIQTIIRDITTRKLAVDDASDHVVITDRRGKIVYANKAAERMTGFERAEMIGQTPAKWGNCVGNKAEADIASCQRAWDLIRQGESSFVGEVVNQKKNGEQYVADLHTSPVYDDNGNISLYIWIERDITRLKQIDRAKTEFLSLASHQLRTPIASISLSAELLLRQVAGPLEPKQKQYIEEIHQNSLAMAELVSALLSVSRIELGTFLIERDNFDLPKHLRQVVASLALQAEAKEVAINESYCDLPSIRFDKGVVTMVVENLLSNAIRYTKSGGRIEVRLERRPEDILITVTDTGCGIPLEDQPKIFSKFFRAGNAQTASQQGSGLGLYIVHSILARVNGRVWFESAEGKGSSFFVTIPLSELGLAD